MTLTSKPRRIAAATFLAIALAATCSAILVQALQLVSGPSPTAQVGVPYTSGFVASGGVPPYTYSIVSGSLPNGLNINPTTGAVTGTPTLAGIYDFTGQVIDMQSVLTDAPGTGTGTNAAKKRTLASGNHAASFSHSYSITVAPAAPSPTPVPPSVWMAMTGLAGAGLLGLRKRRA